jgi:hypothetical protein
VAENIVETSGPGQSKVVIDPAEGWEQTIVPALEDVMKEAIGET